MLSDYVKDLFKKTALNENSQKFDLIRVADVKAIKLIERYKVKSVELKVEINKSTAASFESDPKNWFSAVLGALILRDPKVEELRNSLNGTAKILINVPDGDLLATSGGLDALAMSVVDDEESEDYVINLRNGEVIKPNQISVRKLVKLERVANSVSVDQAWTQMKIFLQELRENGQIKI